MATISTSAAATAAPTAAVTPVRAAAAGEPLYAFNTGLVLTVNSTAKGAAVRVETNAGTAGQRWITGAHQSLRPAASQGLCLNVPGGSYRTGVKLELWTCDGHASERFGSSAAAAHTVVRYLRPSARTAFCVTSLAVAVNVTVARVELARCSGLTTQAWSSTNLDGVAGYLSDAWSVQAQHPTTTGSAVTASSGSTSLLDEAWISSYTGVKEGSPVVLKPVLDTSLCAELAGGEQHGTALKLASCTGSASQQFMGITLIANANYAWSYLTTADSRFCVQAAATGAKSARPVVLGPCAGNNRDTWMATVDLTTGTSGQYQEIYTATGPGASSLEFSMAASGSGRSGSGIVVARDTQAAAQVWTDLAPGQTRATANADGSITLRLLSDESLCLTVPDADYALGVQLIAQTCNGSVDQEFVRNGQFGSIGLIAAGAGEFCVGAPDGVATAGPVELEPCAQHDEVWTTFLSWYGWAGVLPSATTPVADPSEPVVLSDASASGGSVGVAADGPANWFTSQDWTQVSVSGGFEIQSFYDPGLCLDAPDTTEGTQLTAAPCTGSSDQVFAFAAATGAGRLWELAATPSSARMCVAVGSVSGTAGLPLTLQSCSASAADEAWNGPSTQL